MSRHLVVIDMQRVFADPSGGWATPGFAAIVPTVAALAQHCAPRSPSPASARGEPTGAWRGCYEQRPFALRPPDASLWDLVSELGPTARPSTPRPSRSGVPS